MQEGAAVWSRSPVKGSMISSSLIAPASVTATAIPVRPTLSVLRPTSRIPGVDASTRYSAARTPAGAGVWASPRSSANFTTACR